MVRQRMEGIGHADMVVGTIGPFADHDVRRYAGNVCLVGKRNQIEHQAHLLIEIGQLTDWCVG